MTKMRLQARTAVVTGAAKGIGRAIATSLAQRGCHLALVDIDEEGLLQTEALLRPSDVRVSCHVVDVASNESVEKLPAVITERHSSIDLLVNNAGVALGGTFDRVSAENFDWLFAINFHGVVRMTRAFLPMLKRSDDARIVNVSSVFGLIAPPGQTAYVASKFAVRGFSESLRHELQGSSVGVTVVHPGGVATTIAETARIPADATLEEVVQQRRRFRRALRMPPAVAGEIIVKGIEQRRARVLVGTDAHLLALIERLAPTMYWRLLGASARLP